MHSPSLYSLVAGLLPLATGFVIPISPDQSQSPLFQTPENLFAPSPEGQASSPYKIPTRYESTVLARRLLSLSNFGVLSTIFPPSSSSSSGQDASSSSSDHPPSISENRPSTVANAPIGISDYVADCEDQGDPTILALYVATTFKNAAPEAEEDGVVRNISLSLDWWTQYRDLKTHHHHHNNKKNRDIDSSSTTTSTFDLGLYSPASLPRITIIGHLEPLADEDVREKNIAGCFLGRHPDSKWWLPGSEGAAHMGRWLRLVAEEIYMIGGFGDRAYIGWLDPEEWRGVTAKEIGKAKLPGEKKK